MRIVIFLTFSILSSLLLQGQTDSEPTYYFDQLFPKSGIFIRPDSLPDGIWIAYCATNKSQIGLKLHYKYGKRNGETISFWPNGNIQQKGFYKDGCLIGLNEKWYENGEKESESNCIIENSKLFSSKCSKINYWTPEGEQLIKDGTGKYLSYHDNGKLQVQGAYQDGKQIGQWKWFYDNGNLQYIENFIDGKRSGEYISYFVNGQIRTKGLYLNDKQVDKWEDWYNNGLKRQTEFRVEGKMDGEANYWHKNGQLSASGIYKLGKKEGNWKYWDDEGNLETEEIFINGDLIETKNYR